MRKNSLFVVTLVAWALVLGACSKQKKASTTPAAAPAQPHARTRPAVPPSAAVATVTGAGSEGTPAFAPIYFEYESAVIRQGSRDTLERIADYMRKSQGSRLMITGHCDERGTTEYNIALGDLRARAARDYLYRLGVDEGRMRTVSFGEEQPADPGHDEAAWSRNRRSEWQLEPGR